MKILAKKPDWWLRTVKRLGGVFEVGPVFMVVHDDEVFAGWRRVVRAELILWPHEARPQSYRRGA